MSRAQWLEDRFDGIGASEAAAVVGLSPWKTNLELYYEKRERRPSKDLSGVPNVQFGINAEPHLISLFALDYPQYEVITLPDAHTLVKSTAYPWLFCTPDAYLTDKRNGELGLLEIKTEEIMRAGQIKEWNGRIPTHYYIQVLHQLLASARQFVIVKARLKFPRDADGLQKVELRHYMIARDDVDEDLNMLLLSEVKFWECVKTGVEPGLLINFKRG